MWALEIKLSVQSMTWKHNGKHPKASVIKLTTYLPISAGYL